MNSDQTFRIVILGAGFSQPAGLPLGTDLFTQIRQNISTSYGPDNHVERDLTRYVTYVSDCEGNGITVATVNHESFLAFLDREHYLGLKGGDTWSDEGNESQLMIKHAIAAIIHQQTPETPLPLYRDFARQISTTDWLITFNYDTLLEDALDAEGVPYRLFQNRYSDVSPTYNTVDNSRDEVVILKLHGSVDWCDRTHYEERVEVSKQYDFHYDVKHPVFGRYKLVKSAPLVDGIRSLNDPLLKIVRIADIGPLIGLGFNEWCPLIIHPSQAKLPYIAPLRDFWWGSQKSGGWNLSLAVVGYSLPGDDEYARQMLFHMFSNYTEYEPDLEFMGRKKTPIRILDFAPRGESGARIRSRYRFADWSRTELNLDGFSRETINWLFS